MSVAEQEAWQQQQFDDLKRRATDQQETIERLREALRFFLAVVDESSGVIGYHLNGSMAGWGEWQDEIDNAKALAATATEEKGDG